MYDPLLKQTDSCPSNIGSQSDARGIGVLGIFGIVDGTFGIIAGIGGIGIGGIGIGCIGIGGIGIGGIDVGGIDLGGIPVTGRIVGIIVGTRVCDCIGGSDGVDDMESIAAVIRGPCPCICCCMGMDPPCAPARSACSIFTVGCTPPEGIAS